MPVYPPPTPNPTWPIGTGYAMAYTTELRSTPSYVSNSQASAYTGGLLDLLQAARLTDLNTLRVAYENLRVMTEGNRQQLNALLTDMMNKGVIAP